MKIIIIYLTLITSIIACKKTSTNYKETDMTNNKLTKDNYVATMLKEIKHYPKEPIYYFYVGNSLCVYEILVNDFPIQKSYKYEQQATPIYINIGILKSGKQKITYRIYPAPKEFNGDSDVFDSETEFNVTVYVNDNATGLEVGEEKLIIKHNAPTKIRMGGSSNDIAVKEFAGKGKKYYEHSFYFDAEVPYENIGYTNGQDLRKLNQKDLESAVIKFYQKQWKIYNDKNTDDLFFYLYIKEKELRQSMYEEKKELEQNLKEYLEPLALKNYKPEPLKDYKMAFYGDGKMVALEQTSMDIRLRGEGALWGLDNDPKGRTAYFHYRYLFLQQGKSLNELQVVR
jgi:hypothetical protein